MGRNLFLFSVALILLAAACGGEDPGSSPVSPQTIFTEVPTEIDTSSRFLFYLHGRIIEDQGPRPTHPRFGVYEYQEVLNVFVERGFVVISEQRPPGAKVAEYAKKAAEQVRTLIAAGVPPQNITVVGFSKGGSIAVLASSELADDQVNFVFIAACGTWLESWPKVVARGRLLSLREASDDLVISCEILSERLSGSGEYREIVFNLGGGHGAFYRPRSEWVEPIVAWSGI